MLLAPARTRYLIFIFRFIHINLHYTHHHIYPLFVWHFYPLEITCMTPTSNHLQIINASFTDIVYLVYYVCALRQWKSTGTILQSKCCLFSQDDDKRHAKLLDAISGLGGKKVSVTINSTSYFDMCQ